MKDNTKTSIVFRVFTIKLNRGADSDLARTILKDYRYFNILLSRRFTTTGYENQKERYEQKSAGTDSGLNTKEE